MSKRASAENSGAEFSPQKTAALITLDSATGTALGIHGLDLPLESKQQLQDTIVITSFCNLARDPSTPKILLVEFCRVMIPAMSTGSQVKGELEHMLSICLMEDMKAVDDGLAALKDQTAKLSKPMASQI